MVVAQWQAWTDAGTLSKPEAMVAYCDLIMDIEPDYMFKVCNNRACVNLYAALVLYTVCVFFFIKQQQQTHLFLAKMLTLYLRCTIDDDCMAPKG